MQNHITEDIIVGVLSGIEQPYSTKNGAMHYERIFIGGNKITGVVVPRELVRDFNASIGTYVRLAIVSRIHANRAARIIAAIQHQDNTVSHINANVSRSEAAWLAVKHTKKDLFIAQAALFLFYALTCNMLQAFVAVPESLVEALGKWGLNFTVAAIVLGAQLINNEWISPSCSNKIKQALRRMAKAFSQQAGD